MRWIKLKYRLKGPVIVDRQTPFDGVFSYYYAMYKNYYLENKKELYQDFLTYDVYGYVEELPITRTLYKDKYFYNISYPIFSKPVRLLQKRPTKRDYKFGIYKMIQSDYFYVFVQPEKEKEVLDVAATIKSIGKKTEINNDNAEFVNYDYIEIDNFHYQDILLRPVPIDMLTDRSEYLIFNTRLIPPYYIKNENYSTLCYIDSRIINIAGI